MWYVPLDYEKIKNRGKDILSIPLTCIMYTALADLLHSSSSTAPAPGKRRWSVHSTRTEFTPSSTALYQVCYERGRRGEEGGGLNEVVDEVKDDVGWDK